MSDPNRASRWATLAVAGMLLFPSAALAATGTVTERVNLREKPSTEATVVTKIDEDATVSILSSEGSWLHVTASGRTGYILSDYVQIKTTAASGTVKTSDNAVLREQPNTGAAKIDIYRSGTAVTLLKQSSDWYQVRVNDGGRTGWMHESVLPVGGSAPGATAATSRGATESAAATAAAPAAAKLGTTTASENVHLRAKASTSGTSLGVVNSGTTVAVNSLADGWANVTVNGKTGYIRSDFLGTITGAASGTDLKKGDANASVKDLQSALSKLGYLSDAADGKFGSDTYSAVRQYQSDNGMERTGVVSRELLARVVTESQTMPVIPETTTPPVAEEPPADLPVGRVIEVADEPAAPSTTATAPNSSVEKITWSTAKGLIPEHQDLSVLDIRTGKTYVIRAFSLGNHADVETATSSDTAALKSTYGGKWSWDPRPVLVTFNGKTYAAAINGMPHGGDTIGSNGMSGQICLHFKGSTTHNGNRSYESDFQDAVSEAWSYR